VRPAAHETRGHVFELRQFDLQFAFVRACALREDVEDQSGAINDPTLRELLEVALLDRRQRVIDQDQVGVGRLFLRLEFLGLAAADEEFGIRALDARAQGADHAGAGGTRKFAEFGQGLWVVASQPLRLQQQRAFTFARPFKQ